MWSSKPLTIEQVQFMRGQVRMLQTIHKLPEEIELAKTRLKEHFELNQVMRKETE